MSRENRIGRITNEDVKRDLDEGFKAAADSMTTQSNDRELKAAHIQYLDTYFRSLMSLNALGMGKISSHDQVLLLLWKDWNTRPHLPEGGVREAVVREVEVQIQGCAVSMITPPDVKDERRLREEGLRRILSLLPPQERKR